MASLVAAEPSKSKVATDGAVKKVAPSSPPRAAGVGDSTARANAEVIGMLKAAAAKGDVEALYQLGGKYMYGLGVPMDKAEGARWWIKAAEAGHVEAQRNLGASYNNGDGVKVDVERADYWTRKAIEQGDALAMYNMGKHYQHGHGVPKDTTQMILWFERSAQAGCVDAQIWLGLSFSSGINGVGMDREEGCRWYAMGARQDDRDCLMGLGLAYYAGEGVPQDTAEAVRLWRRAAEQGLGAAQGMLGIAYSEGFEVAESQLEAYVWLKLAANQGEDTARKSAASVAEQLTKSEMARAREKIAAFKPRGPAPMVAVNLPMPAMPRMPAAPGRPQTPGPQGKPKHEEDDGVLSGTGFFITKSGYIVTNYHVIGLGRTLHIVEGKDKEWRAKLVAHDKKADLAVLKVETAEHACLPIITSKTVKLGATVATVGFPNPDVQGVAPKLAKGEIAALSGVLDDPDRFQISVPLQPGNSGGSLVDARGNVVGIVCGILDQEVALATTGTLANSVAYAVKGSLLLELLTTLPGVAGQLPTPITTAREFEDVISDVERATVLIIAE